MALSHLKRNIEEKLATFRVELYRDDELDGNRYKNAGRSTLGLGIFGGLVAVRS